MATEIIVSLIALAGSALGTFAGIFLNTKLSNYRIEQLEKKVDKHNSVGSSICVVADGYEGWFKLVEDVQSGNLVVDPAPFDQLAGEISSMEIKEPVMDIVQGTDPRSLETKVAECPSQFSPENRACCFKLFW